MTASFVLATLVGSAPVHASPYPFSASATPAEANRSAATSRVATDFALGASGFGTQVAGGSLPTASDATAYQRIGCTTFAGDERTTTEAAVTVPGLGTLSGVTTRVWTERVGDRVSSYSTQSIAKLTLADNPVGVLEIRGIESMSHAFNDGGRYGAQTRGSIARIVFTPTGGAPQTLDLPTPDRALEIPGLARIALGSAQKRSSSDGALARANVVKVDVLPLGSVVRVAQSEATIDGGITRGSFSGYSAALHARGVDGNVRVGRTPLSLMPCQGTDDRARVKDTARVELGDQIVARGVASGQIGTQAPNRTHGIERAEVARVSLFDGRIQIHGIVGQASVSRGGGTLTRSTQGTHVLEVVADGRSYAFPEVGALTIPGLVKLEDDVRTRLKNGIKVVALRITLLDGSAATIDLGIAQLQIRPSFTR